MRDNLKMRRAVALAVTVAGCGTVAGSDQGRDATVADTTMDTQPGEADGDETPLPFGVGWLIGLEADALSSFTDVAIDRRGFVYGVGDVLGDLAIGGETVGRAAPFRSGYLVVRRSDGTREWDLVIPSGYAADAQVRLWSVAVDRSGLAYVAGEDSARSDGRTGALLAKVTSEGVVEWRRRLGDDWSSAQQVAARLDGSVIIYGVFNGNGKTVDLGTGPQPSNDTTVFVTAFGSGGAVLWARPLHTGTGHSQPSALVLDEGGRMYASGQFAGTIDFGGGPIVATHSFDRFVVALEADGSLRWAERFDGFDVAEGEPHDSTPIAVDAAHRIYVAGTFSGSMAIGATVLTSTGRDIYLASLTADGNPIATSKIDIPETPYLTDLVTDPTGKLLLAAGMSDRGAMMLLRSGADLAPEWTWSPPSGARFGWLSISPADPTMVAIGGMYDGRFAIGHTSLEVTPPTRGCYLGLLTLRR